MPPMRVVIADRHGGPDVLTLVQRDAPAPGPGQLLVDVAAAGVNFADIYRREGRPPYSGEVPYVPGMEGAGTVAATGPGEIVRTSLLPALKLLRSLCGSKSPAMPT